MAGIFALFFFDEVPKVRTDIMQKLPLVGDYFVREIPPEDNVSFAALRSLVLCVTEGFYLGRVGGFLFWGWGG